MTLRHRRLSKLLADAFRWRALVRAVEENQRRAHLGGGVFLCMMPANEHDAPWASIQAHDHETPRGTVWIIEAATLDGAADALRERQGEPVHSTTGARAPVECAP